VADERHIIEIILQARDDTAAALGSATANVKAFEKVAEDSTRQNEAFRKSFNDLNREVSANDVEMSKLQKSIQNTKGITTSTAASIQQLEQASRKLSQAIGNENATRADQLKAQQEYEKALAQANKSITENTNLNRSQAAQLTQNVAALNRLVAATEQLRKVQAELNTAENQQRAARKAANDEFISASRQRLTAIQNERRDQQEADRAAEESSRRRQQQFLADSALRLKAIQNERKEQEAADREAAARATRDQQRFLSDARARLQAIENARKADQQHDRETEASRQRQLALGRQYVQQLQEIQRIQEARQKAVAAGDTVEHVRLEFDNRDAVAKAEALSKEINTIFRNRNDIHIDFNDTEALAHAKALDEMFNELFKGVKVDVKFDVDQVSLARMAAMSKEMDNVGRSSDDVGGRLGFLQGLLSSLGDGFDQSSGRIASFDNFLRGLMSLGIALFLNQLVLLAGAAAGALGALASSAAVAGATLGGAFSAGLMQALPVLGIFAAAAMRIKAVIDAVQQAQLLQQQQSYKGAQQAQKDTSAQDAVISAQERVANATAAVTAAQEKLNQARDDAAQKLADLILQEQGLRLSLDQNQAAQRAAVSRGDTARLPELFLQRDQTQNQLGQVGADITQRQTGTAPEIKQAQDALKQAKQQAGDAARELNKAKGAADIAAAGITAASGKLNFLIGQMSDAEKHLYNVLNGFQDQFRHVSQVITEPLINAFADAIGKIEKLMGDKKIVNAFRGLAGGLADSFTKIFDNFTSPRAINTLLSFIDGAKKNLKPLTDIAINISNAFIDFASAAQPALHTILVWVDDISQKVADFFSSARKSGDLRDFFKDGVTQLKAWGDLLVSIGKLFIAIIGPGGGAKEGLKLVREMADTIGGWADKIDKPGSKLNEFFKRFFKLSGEMIGAMGPVLDSIANEFDKTFTKKGVSSVQAFAQFLAKVLIPAIGNFARTLGQITTDFGKFSSQHPQITKMASAFLSAVLVFGLLSKVLTIFGPIIGAFKFLGKYMAMRWVTEKLLGPLSNGVRTGGLLADVLERVAGIVIGPWGIAIGIILLVLAKLHLLDDLVRALERPFVEIWKQVEPPLKRLQVAFAALWDALNKGNGAFKLLTPVLKFLIDMIGSTLASIGKAIGLVLGGIIDVIAGIINIITGLLTGNWKMAWDGLKEVVEGAARAILGVVELLLFRGLGKLFDGILGFILEWSGKFIKFLAGGIRDGVQAAARLIGRLPGAIKNVLEEMIAAWRNGIPSFLKFLGGIGRSVFDAISGGFSQVFTFFRNLPGRIVNLLKNVGGEIASVFKDVGTKILDTIFAGLKNPAGAAKALANQLIDLLNFLIPNKIPIPGAPDINLPDNPIPHFATGGRVGSGFGGGDRRLIMAEDGEWVIRKEAVSRFGEGFMAWINGGFGTAGDRKAVGGPVTGGPNPVADPSTSKSWQVMWTAIEKITRAGTETTIGLMNDMRDAIANTIEALYRDIRSSIAEIQNSFDSRGKAIVKSWTDTFMSIQSVAYAGLDYIGHSTNEALKALGEQAINFGFSKPSATGQATAADTQAAGFASGGIVGNLGERGRDMVPAWLGRGEAVLNFAHQKIVNSALWNQYGTTLEGLFKRNFAYHAGGPGQMGYASGGFTGPGQSGAGFTPVWNFAKNKFGMSYYTGYQGHNQMTSSGNISDHWYHRALDMGNGVLTHGEDALNAFFKTKLPQVVKQLIWRGVDQFKGYNIGDHTDHVHLAMYDPYAFNGPRMARILSRAARGLSITDLLSDTEGGAANVDHVHTPGVSGRGPLAKVLRKIFSKVTGAANKAIDKIAMKLLGGTDAGPMHGEPYDGPLDHQFEGFKVGTGGNQPQLTPDQVKMLAEHAGLPGTTFEQIAHGESNYYPGVISNDGGYGLWQMTPRVWGSEAIAYMNSLGGLQAMFNPWKNAQMAAYLYHNAGNTIAPWYGTKYVTGAPHAQGGFVGRLQQFATGGTVQGPEGAPVPIIAHAGEWVLNQIQQSKLAMLLGATTGKLRDFLGFTGGPTSFAGGGDVTPFRGSVKGSNYTLPMVNPEDLAGIEREIGLVHTAIMNISRKGKVGKQVSSFLTKIRALTDQDGYLDQMGNAIETLGTHLQNAFALAQVGFVRVASGLVRRKGGPLTDAVAIANTTVVNLDKIGDALRDEMRVASRGLAETNASIRSLREGGITKGEEDKFKSLVAARAKFKSSLDDLDAKYAQNRADRYQANVDRFNAQTDAALRPSTRAGNAAELAGRIASAAGDVSGVNLASQASQQALEAQKGILVGRAAEAARRAARDPRWQKVADDIQKQVDDLTVTITQNISAQQKAAIDAVNTAATRRQTALNLRGRAADLLAAGGDALGAAKNRIGVANDQISSTTQQRDELLALVAKTTAGTDRYDALIDQINDLNQTIAEQTQAARDLNFTYRQTATDIISGRSSRTTGLIGTATDIITKVGNLSGTQDTAGLLAFANQTKAVLSNGAQEIRKNITDALSDPNGAFGTSGNSVLATLSAAFTQGPGSFASALATLSPTIANLESTMSGPEKDAFDALIQSMIDNTTATLDNSQTISDLTGSITQPQGFSSSAWQWFRTAIFNGMGSVLPEYEIPQMHTGGEVTRSGVFDLQVGERVVKPGQGQGANVSITVNEAGGPVDTEWIASRVGWEFKNK
jgi:hypothetical protein